MEIWQVSGIDKIILRRARMFEKSWGFNCPAEEAVSSRVLRISLWGSVALSLTNQNLLVNRPKGLVDFPTEWVFCRTELKFSEEITFVIQNCFLSLIESQCSAKEGKLKGAITYREQSGVIIGASCVAKTPNIFLEGTRRSVHNPPQLVLCAALGTLSLGKSCKMLPRSNERARKCNL